MSAGTCVLPVLVWLEAVRLTATRSWRALSRACEPVTSLHGFAGLRIVAQTASTSLPEARGVLILLLWFCAIFMLAGLQKFAGKTGLRCALCEDEACTVAQLGSVVAPELPCGFAADARRCVAPLVCLPARDNPLSVWTSFNDFRWASLSVLRVALAGGWWEVLSVLAAGGGRGAAVAFCVPLVVGTGHLLVPLFASMQSDMFGAAWRAYAKGAEKEYAAFKVTLRRNLSGLGIWCCVSLRLQHPDALVHHRHHSHEAPKAVEPPRPGQFVLAVERTLFSPQLPFVLAACHVVNIVAMTIASAGMTEEARAGTHYVNLIITVVFALKTAGQLVVLGVVGFGASWSRVLEGVVTLISLVVLLPQTGARYGVSVLRCFCVLAAVLGSEPPMWLQRRLRRDAGLRRLHEALSHSFINAKELYLLAGVYVLLWAVIGLVVFGGSASESPASATSFTTLLSALYTSFALLTGANTWHRAMWHQMKSVGTPAVLFGIVQQMGAVFVMATLKGAFVRSFAVKEDTERTHVQQLDDAAEMHDADVAVSSVAASLEERIRTMKRHRAAREVHSMRNWLKQAGRIHDFTGYDSDDDGEYVPGDTRTAKAERRKARREAHEDWVAPKVFTAPDGTEVVDDGCDGFRPQDSELRDPEPGWTPQGMTFLTDGLDVPVLLEDAHDRRRRYTCLLRGRQQLLRERHRENRKAELIAAGLSSGSEHGSSDDDRSDDESPPTANSLAAAARSKRVAPREVPVPTVGQAAGILQPAWLTKKITVAPASSVTAFEPTGSNAQRRARELVRHAQSLASSHPAVPIALAGTAAVVPMCEDEELWVPCGDDLPLPLLQKSTSKRVGAMAGLHGTPRACLVIDTEELPVPYTRDLPDRPMVPMMTGPVSCEYMRHDSLWLFLPNNLFRRLLFIITMHKYYRIACAITTLIACAVYAAEPAGDDPRSARAGELSYVDMLINLFFGYELGIKVVVRGGFMHPGSVLRTRSGWLEFAAFAGGLAGTLGPPRELRALRCLRLYTLLPLLRSFEFARPLAILLTVLERAAPTLRRLFLLGAVALFLFAVASTQILGGQGTRCADPLSAADTALCSGLFIDARGGARRRAPLTPVLHFEDVPNAALSLFAVLTLDEWPSLVRPFVERDFAAVLLFVVWIALAVMLWLNLVFGAVVDAYLRVSLLLNGRRLGDETAHRDWAAAFRLRRQQVERAERLAAEGMSAATSMARQAATTLIEQRWFEPVMCLAIGVNILLVAVEDAVPDRQARQQLSHSAEIAFAVIFSLELAVQMTAVGVVSFLRNSRNRVDLVVTLSSVLVLISGSTSFNVNVLRLLRLERVIRLFPHTRRLQLLLQTLFTALPGLAALVVVALIMLVVYSILGMALFGLHDPVLHPTAAASPATAVDFRTFGLAMLTMFKLFTLDGWSGAMQQLLRCEGVVYLYDGAVPFAERCEFTPAPPLFLISFTICCTYMTSSLAMAVVFDAYRISLDDFGVTSDVGDTLRRVHVLNAIAERFMRPVRRTRAIRLGVDEDTMMRRRLLIKK